MVALRTSPVLHASGGSFVPMKLAWSAGLGATIGDGRQRMPMIALSDWLGAVQWAADAPHADGAYNLTLPQPTTNAEFTEALGSLLHRPAVVPAPAVVLRKAGGKLGGLVLDSVNAVPEALTRSSVVKASSRWRWVFINFRSPGAPRWPICVICSGMPG